MDSEMTLALTKEYLQRMQQIYLDKTELTAYARGSKDMITEILWFIEDQEKK